MASCKVQVPAPAQEPGYVKPRWHDRLDSILLAVIVVLSISICWQYKATQETSDYFTAEYKEHKPNIDKLYRAAGKFNIASEAVVRLFNGNLPKLVNDFVRADWKGTAEAVRTFTSSARVAFKNAEGTDFDEVAEGMAFVESVATKAAEFQNLNPPTIDGGNQLTGEGGLYFEVLHYLHDFIKTSTSVPAWAALGTDCNAAVDRLRAITWAADFECREWSDATQTYLWTTCNWDVNQDMADVWDGAKKICDVIGSMQ